MALAHTPAFERSKITQPGFGCRDRSGDYLSKASVIPMIFDRRSKLNRPGPRNARGEYRYPLPPDHPLKMQLVRPDGEVIDVLPVDLTVRGAGFRSWPDVELGEDEVFDVVVSSAEDGWTVRTPGVVRHAAEDDDAIDWGLEFINLGNLYGQWDNVLGRYFNRRRAKRVAPDLDRKIAGELIRGEQAVSAAIHDLTTFGAGVTVRHSEAADLDRNEVVEIRFRLPKGRRHLQGKAFVRQLRHAGAHDFVGLEFDLTDPDGMAVWERQINAYCTKRARAVSEWQEAWGGAA